MKNLHIAFPPVRHAEIVAETWQKMRREANSPSRQSTEGKTRDGRRLALPGPSAGSRWFVEVEKLTRIGDLISAKTGCGQRLPPASSRADSAKPYGL